MRAENDMSTKDSDITNERRCTIQAAIAVAEMGGRFYDALGVDYSGKPFVEHVQDWPALKGVVVETSTEAIKLGAYFIERVFLGGSGWRERYGWRLCSYRVDPKGKSGGHSYSGETFKNADDFWAAMRTVEDLAERAKRAKGL